MLTETLSISSAGSIYVNMQNGLVKPYLRRGGWARAERGWIINFGVPGKGWLFNYPWGWVILFFFLFLFFLTGIGTYLTQSTTGVTPSSSKGRKRVQPWQKKYTRLVYKRDDNFMYCKIFTNAKKSNG